MPHLYNNRRKVGIRDYTIALGKKGDKEHDKIEKPPTLGLDSSVGRAPAHQCRGGWFKSSLS